MTGEAHRQSLVSSRFVAFVRRMRSSLSFVGSVLKPFRIFVDENAFRHSAVDVNVLKFDANSQNRDLMDASLTRMRSLVEKRGTKRMNKHGRMNKRRTTVTEFTIYRHVG